MNLKDFFSFDRFWNIHKKYFIKATLPNKLWWKTTNIIRSRNHKNRLCFFLHPV